MIKVKVIFKSFRSLVNTLNVKVTHVVSQNFFLSTRVLKHNKFYEIKQFSKVDIKQTSINEICAICKEIGPLTKNNIVKYILL